MSKEASEILLRLDILHRHDWHKTYEAITKKDSDCVIDNIMIDKEIANYDAKGVKYITILDKEYPEEFRKSIFRPPFVIYYTGDLSLLRKAIDSKEYVYLNGPNKFGLDASKCITSNYGVISFGKNELNLFIPGKYIEKKSLSLLSTIPVLCKKLACTTTMRKHSNFPFIVGVGLNNGLDNEIYVVPTVNPSENNELIKDGAFLLDSKEQLID